MTATVPLEVTGRVEQPTRNGHAAPTSAPADAPVVELDRLASETIMVPVKVTTPLIVCRFSEKAKRKMLDEMQGKKAPKEKRDPEADYQASRHRTPTGDGFPVLGFKAATIGAARFYGKSVTMASLKQYLFFQGVPSDDATELLVAITGEPRMREDYVRINNGRGTDLRYRAEYPEWSAVLTVTYVANCISRNSVLSLIDAGGMGVGVGEWRPQRGGQNGTYGIDTERKVEVIR